jgi:hypothetical protein
MNHNVLRQDAKPQPGIPPDVFDMERAPAGMPSQDGASTPANTAVTSSSVGAGGLASKIGPVHFMLLAGVLAATWIVWPDGSARQQSSIQSNARLLSTQPKPGKPAETALSRAGESPSRAMQAAVPARSQSTAMDAPNQPLSVSTQIVEQQAQQATALVAAIDALNLRLAALEMRQVAQTKAALPPVAPALIQPVGVPNSSASQRPRASTRAKGAVPSTTPTLTAYSLNTIYPGQAWVQHVERVYVVQEGDTIDELKIIRIDPQHRQVLTSRGFIR